MSNLLLFLGLFGSVNCIAQGVFLNEIRANDASTDDSEFVEIIGPAGTDISGWSIQHINGSGGSVVFTYTFPENSIIPDDGITDKGGTNVGFIVVKNSNHTVENVDFEWGNTGLQNGPDGIILQDASGLRVQAITWNGSGDLEGGTPPWRNIGADANDDRSLCAPDDVTETSALPWLLTTASPGSINVNQNSSDISLPVQLTSFRAVPGDGLITLRWITAAEVDNMGFIIERSEIREGEYTEIGSYLTSNDLVGHGNTSVETKYSYVDCTVYNGLTYWYRLTDVDVNGTRSVHTPISAIPNSVSIEIKEFKTLDTPENFELMQNYPNPFNPATIIKFHLPEDDDISLMIYNVLGKQIFTLYKGWLSAGSYELKWHGIDVSGRHVSAGTYFYALTSPNYNECRKMYLIR